MLQSQQSNNWLASLPIHLNITSSNHYKPHVTRVTIQTATNHKKEESQPSQTKTSTNSTLLSTKNIPLVTLPKPTLAPTPQNQSGHKCPIRAMRGLGCGAVAGCRGRVSWPYAMVGCRGIGCARFDASPQNLI